MLNFLLAGMCSLSIILIFAALARTMNAPSRVDAVMNQYTQTKSLEEMELAQPFTARVLRPLFRNMAGVFAQRTPQQMLQSMRHKLDLAGNPFDIPAVEFMGLRVAVAILTAVLLATAFTLLGSSSWAFVMLLVGGILGFYLPVLWLDLKIRTRQEEIELALPDALDMLTICVEAGMGLDAAMGRVAERWNNELGYAFRRALTEIRVGKARHEAFRDMANRAEVADLTNFIAAVIQNERLGGGIAKLLRIQSEQMRVTRRQRAYTRVNQTPVKMVFPLVFCFFPALFVVLLGPAIIRIVTRGF